MKQLPLEAQVVSSQTALSPNLPEGSAPVPASAPPCIVGRDGFAALATGAADLLLWPVVGAIHSGALVVLAITTLVSLFLVLLFTVRLARAMRSPRAIGLNLALSLLLVMPLKLIPFLHLLFPTWPVWVPLHPYWMLYASTFHKVHGLDNLGLIWIAASLGVALSRLVREFKLLLPMSVALALVDLYTVFGGGVVATAISGKNTVAQAAMTALTVQLPTMQPTSGAAPFTLNIGFADFLFIALFFACFAHFGIPSRRTFYVLFVTLFFYMAIVFSFGPALPALVPVAVVVIGMHWRRFRYKRSEAFALLYVGLLVSGILAYLSFRARHG